MPNTVPERQWTLAERNLGTVGRDWSTSDVFERLVRGTERGLGHVWLDGQSVSPSSHPWLLQGVPLILLAFTSDE